MAAAWSLPAAAATGFPARSAAAEPRSSPATWCACARGQRTRRLAVVERLPTPQRPLPQRQPRRRRGHRVQPGPARHRRRTAANLRPVHHRPLPGGRRLRRDRTAADPQQAGPAGRLGRPLVHRHATAIGIPVVTVSAKQAPGSMPSRSPAGPRTLLAGQSGVGKSSLTNALCEDAYRATGPLGGIRPGQAHHRLVGDRAAALGRADGLPGRTGLCTAGRAAAGRPTRLPRDHPAGARLPVPGLPAPAGTTVRGAGGRRRRDGSTAGAMKATGGSLNLTRQLDEKRGWRG